MWAGHLAYALYPFYLLYFFCGEGFPSEIECDAVMAEVCRVSVCVRGGHFGRRRHQKTRICMFDIGLRVSSAARIKRRIMDAATGTLHLRLQRPNSWSPPKYHAECTQCVAFRWWKVAAKKKNSIFNLVSLCSPLPYSAQMESIYCNLCEKNMYN